MIADFIESALIIDDKPKEVAYLINTLENKGIAVTFYEPNKIKGRRLKNRKIIFLDLYIDPAITDLKGNISKIRKIFKTKIGKKFGSYGIVLWSAHIDEMEEFQKRIHNDKNEYTLPLFIVGLNKTTYQNKNSSLFDDINTELNNNSAATFFLEWSNSIQQAQNATVSRIYSLLPNYETLSGDFTFILKKLALNYTGIGETQIGSYPLHIDAFKSFDDILHAELINCQKAGTNLFSNSTDFSNQNDLPKIYSQLNKAILIDDVNISQKTVIPGNVYEIKKTKSKFKSDKSPQNAKNIVFEITPPCDFSNSGKRIKARLVGGFIVDATNDPKKIIDNLKCKKDCFYSEVFPIMISGCKTPQLLILDFRYFGDEDDSNLQNASKYKILFRAKPKLFADVLQKFSSHAARLGLSVIHS